MSHEISVDTNVRFDWETGDRLCGEDSSIIFEVYRGQIYAG